MNPVISPAPEELAASFNSPMKATGPVAGAPERNVPVTSNARPPATPALVQVGEPCFTPNPSVVTPVLWTREKKPVDVTTREMFWERPPSVTVAETTQFEATVYVAVSDEVESTPS